MVLIMLQFYHSHSTDHSLIICIHCEYNFSGWIVFCIVFWFPFTKYQINLSYSKYNLGFVIMVTLSNIEALHAQQCARVDYLEAHQQQTFCLLGFSLCGWRPLSSEVTCSGLPWELILPFETVHEVDKEASGLVDTGEMSSNKLASACE